MVEGELNNAADHNEKLMQPDAPTFDQEPPASEEDNPSSIIDVEDIFADMDFGDYEPMIK